MPLDLNELRAQRERVRQHLEWLDAQIAAAGPEVPVEVSPSVTTPVNPLAQPEPVPDAAPAPEEAKVEGVADVMPLSTEAQGMGQGSKAGCIVAGVVLALLVLFLLFGLPFLLY